MKKDYKTCSKCSVVGEHCDTLDGRTICYSCMDEILHGADRRTCAARGFHMTRSSCGGSGYRELGDHRAEFLIEIHCKCGVSGRWLEVVAATPITDGSWMMGYSFPSGPKYWTMIGYQVTPIPEEEAHKIQATSEPTLQEP